MWIPPNFDSQKIMVSSALDTNETSSFLQECFRNLGFTTYYSKFYYEKEKEELYRRVVDCNFVVILADLSWCKSKKCKLEFDCVLRSQQQDPNKRRPIILPVLLEAPELYEEFQEASQFFAATECVSCQGYNSKQVQDVLISIICEFSDKNGPLAMRSPSLRPASLSSGPSVLDSLSPPISADLFSLNHGGQVVDDSENISLSNNIQENVGMVTLGPGFKNTPILVATWSPNLVLRGYNRVFADTFKITPQMMMTFEHMLPQVIPNRVIHILETQKTYSFPTIIISYTTFGEAFSSFIALRAECGASGKIESILSFQCLVSYEAVIEEIAKPSESLYSLKATSFPFFPHNAPSETQYKNSGSLHSNSFTSGPLAHGDMFPIRGPGSSVQQYSQNAQPKSELVHTEPHRVEVKQETFDTPQALSSATADNSTSGYSVFTYNPEPQSNKRKHSDISPAKGKIQRKYNPKRWKDPDPNEEKAAILRRLTSTPRGVVIPKDSEICIISSATSATPDELIKVTKANKRQRPLFMMTPEDFARQSSSDEEANPASGMSFYNGGCLRGALKKRSEVWKHSNDESRFHFYQGPREY